MMWIYTLFSNFIWREFLRCGSADESPSHTHQIDRDEEGAHEQKRNKERVRGRGRSGERGERSRDRGKRRDLTGNNQRFLPPEKGTVDQYRYSGETASPPRTLLHFFQHRRSAAPAVLV